MKQKSAAKTYSQKLLPYLYRVVNNDHGKNIVHNNVSSKFCSSLFERVFTMLENLTSWIR